MKAFWWRKGLHLEPDSEEEENLLWSLKTFLGIDVEFLLGEGLRRDTKDDLDRLDSIETVLKLSNLDLDELLREHGELDPSETLCIQNS